ncbi:trace amine-associated receptor 3-like [Mercenaria mercenaria]|uniref:trace amine-associated receptor 3-like n=1 Tax=Mercenaria mercenaria TaxID=6596 RepID=UPI00234FAEDD|nr:trace amine-associated receptor 3-like [Mercenaria mercenaria]
MENFNDLNADRLTGAVALLSFLMVTGFIGNLHVLFVYTFRLKPSNHGIYILFLSVQDIIACALLIPLRIYVYINLWTHGNDFTCRFESFLMCLILTASAFTLLLVATDRYRKICCPLGWQIKRRIAKLLCVIVLISACLCSWPVLVLNEPKTIELNNVTITMCGTVDGYMEYQLYHRIIMAAIFFGSLCILTGLYVLIIKAAAKYFSRDIVNGTDQCSKGAHNAFKEQDEYGSKESLIPHEQNIIKPCKDGKPQDNLRVSTKTTRQNTADCTTSPARTEKCNIGPNRTNRSRKTTTIFILITVFYFISYIPFISLDIFLVHGLLTSSTSLSMAGFVAIHIISSCVFINCVANCFIYSCFDTRFRNEIGVMYKMLWYACKH